MGGSTVNYGTCKVDVKWNACTVSVLIVLHNPNPPPHTVEELNARTNSLNATHDSFCLGGTAVVVNVSVP